MAQRDHPPRWIDIPPESIACVLAMLLRRNRRVEVRMMRIADAKETAMKRFSLGQGDTSVDRRSFLKGSVLAAGAATAASSVFDIGLSATTLDRDRDRDQDQDDNDKRAITRGDAAILRFLAAAEIIETDLWQQYTELGGVTAAASGYTAALAVLDEDMGQYISDNTDDEMSHFTFLNAYLALKGVQPVNLDQFRTLPSSQATGAQQIGRLTNLMQLAVDTSWWTRYRATTNPDLGATFPQAIPTLAVGQHPGIPRNDAELGDPSNISRHVQAIANTAAFHFAFIEQGGTSLYSKMAQKCSSLEVLRVVVSIGPTEAMHFQTWHDKAGNAPAVTDGALVFPDLNSGQFATDELFQKNLIMPEPCQFLRTSLPVCSIVRPTAVRNAAMDAANALIGNGLFIGQPPAFFQALRDLASDADAARRET
jgi:Ferritin-like domain